jgi:hypothetical protein
MLSRIKTEPTLVTALVKATLGVLVLAKVIQLTDNQTAAILGVVAAGLSLLLALSVRPFPLPLVTGAVEAGVVLLIVFGVDITAELQAGVYTLVAALLAFFTRQNVTPETKLPALALS